MLDMLEEHCQLFHVSKSEAIRDGIALVILLEYYKKPLLTLLDPDLKDRSLLGKQKQLFELLDSI